MRISDWSSDVCSSDLRHHGFDNALDRAFSRQTCEHARLADANPLGVARIDEELGVEVGWIGNSEQRAVAGGVADIHILLDDRAADRRGDRIDLKRMARLDAGQDLAASDLLADLAAERHDQSWQAGADL